MKPTLPDAIRFAPGSRLRMVIALKPILREAAEKALARHAISLAALEAAVLSVIENQADGGRLIGEFVSDAGDGRATIVATRHDNGDYAFAIDASLADRRRDVVVERMLLQPIGSREMYLSLETDQGPSAVARLRYAADGSVAVSLFTQALSPKIPSALRSLMPAELALATLSVVVDG
ncbi:MAG: hypothetical protein KA144_14560 [Xanthomonadaceae bacterium]|nr:hypothetical protein [Xanthomonadaceae bacterium]